MVFMYEKYCERCRKKNKLRQSDWREFKPKTEHGTPERQEEIAAEIEKDKIVFRGYKVAFWIVDEASKIKKN